MQSGYSSVKFDLQRYFPKATIHISTLEPAWRAKARWVRVQRWSSCCGSSCILGSVILVSCWRRRIRTCPLLSFAPTSWKSTGLTSKEMLVLAFAQHGIHRFGDDSWDWIRILIPLRCEIDRDCFTAPTWIYNFPPATVLSHICFRNWFIFKDTYY